MDAITDQLMVPDTTHATLSKEPVYSRLDAL